MGFWKRIGSMFGKTVLTAAESAVDLAGAGRPVTGGSVAKEVLGRVLRPDGAGMPAPVGLGLYSVFDPTAKAGGRLDDIRFFTNFERADEFAQLVRSTVMMSERVGDRLEWVPVQLPGKPAPR